MKLKTKSKREQQQQKKQRRDNNRRRPFSGMTCDKGKTMAEKMCNSLVQACVEARIFNTPQQHQYPSGLHAVLL